MGELQKELFASQQQILSTLGEIQMVKGTGPIVVSIGYRTEDGVTHEGLLLKEAPALAIEILAACGCYITITPEGALVEKI